MDHTYFSSMGITISLMLLFSLLTLKNDPLKEELIFPPGPDMVEINLVERINSAGTDFCPTPYRNGLVFTSSRGDEVGVGLSGIFKEKFFDLYYSERNESGNYVIPAKMNGEVNTELHDGMATFSSDGFTMYFTRNKPRSKGLVALKIYSAELIGGEWTNVVELPFNSGKFSNSHPTLSKDGQRLYFASDRKGGYGGMDIYVSEKMNGTWSEPRNLGISVNSSANEIFPYVGNDNTVYYASDRKGGWGKLDVYMSEANGKVYGAAQNLGAPFNSSADDFGFYIDRKKEKGFISSNRSGGKGKDDIYEWKIKDDKSKIRKVVLVDKLSGKRISSAEIMVKAGLNNSDNDRLEEIQQGIYKLKIDDESNGYIVNVEKYGYRPLKLVFQKEDLMKKDEHTFYMHKRSMSLLNGEVKNLVDASSIGSAKIELISECDGKKQFATSKGDGTFGFSLMCDCEYTIVVNKDGFKTNHIVIPLYKNKCQGSNLINEVLTLQPAVLIKDRARIDP